MSQAISDLVAFPKSVSHPKSGEALNEIPTIGNNGHYWKISGGKIQDKITNHFSSEFRNEKLDALI
ncbi:hypothetical protein CDL15_Pgr026633 [Punica granatum]|uniref:Uncharacterized protein n=1 Tax=Punica granatum TaxID=22663 RepID=A0A218WL29_PUNGR|nr:hypothetical protein CDL15_Pgr026633 [Punica granatum]